MHTTGQFIAIEGLDGSGKSTQIDLLIAHFKSQKIDTKFVHFPRSHEGVFGELIAKFLRGEFGNVDDVHPQLVALLFAEDRKEFSTTITTWLEQGYFVLVDRYVLSNIAFQCAKVKDVAKKASLRDWINDFEYFYNKIPKPDLSIYLDVPFPFIEESLNIRRLKELRNYLNGKEDIHENDRDLQLRVKSEYDDLLKTDESIQRIICYSSEGAIKSVEEIHHAILKCISKTTTVINA